MCSARRLFACQCANGNIHSGYPLRSDPSGQSGYDKPINDIATSALGQKATSQSVGTTSAFASKADINRRRYDVCLVPIGDKPGAVCLADKDHQWTIKEAIDANVPWCASAAITVLN
jgi:hypothetical protein